MSLVFKDLALVNFGPFRGRQEIDLSTPDGSPVVLIHGENTMGKTQLFSALRWCLYGTFEPRQTQDEAKPLLARRLNLPAKHEGETSFEVVICFTAGSELYQLTRRVEFKENSTNVFADLRVGATVIPPAAIDSEIGRLLHPQISEFFLFDAELLGRFYERLATDRERAFIRESIEAVLGIPALQMARRDVQDLGNEALQRQAKLAKNVDDRERISRKLKELKSASESVERDRVELKKQIATAEAEMAEVKAKLKAVEGLDVDVREQELLEAQMSDGKREEDSILAEMKLLLSTGWRSLAARPLQEALDDVQSQNSRYAENDKTINDVRRQVVVLEDRSRGGICPTCKQPLPPPDKETAQELTDAKRALDSLLVKTGGGKLDLDRERRIAHLIDVKTIKEYKQLHQRLSALQLLQYERKSALNGINDRLQGHKAADIRSLGAKHRALETAIASAQTANKVNDERGQSVAAEQAKLARQLERLPGAKPEIVFEASFFRYLEELLRGTIEAYRERVRADVEKNAQEMFLRLIRDPGGYGGLRIASDYKVELLDKRGIYRATSEGGKQLLALSLIGALKRAAVRGGPVVLDSPLGRLDLEHRANVLQTWIPALGTQAILLVQSGELTKVDAQRLLGSLVGRAYQIVRPTDDPEYAAIERVS